MKSNLYYWFGFLAVLSAFFLSFDVISMAQTNELNEKNTPANNSEVKDPLSLTKYALAGMGIMDDFDFNATKSFATGLFIPVKVRVLPEQFASHIFRGSNVSTMFGVLYLTVETDFPNLTLKRGLHILKMSALDGGIQVIYWGIPSKILRDHSIDVPVVCPDHRNLEKPGTSLDGCEVAESSSGSTPSIGFDWCKFLDNVGIVCEDTIIDLTPFISLLDQAEPSPNSVIGGQYCAVAPDPGYCPPIEA